MEFMRRFTWQTIYIVYWNSLESKSSNAEDIIFALFTKSLRAFRRARVEEEQVVQDDAFGDSALTSRYNTKKPRASQRPPRAPQEAPRGRQETPRVGQEGPITPKMPC